MEIIELKFDEAEELETPKASKDTITYAPVEKGIRRKLKNGKTWS